MVETFECFTQEQVKEINKKIKESNLQKENLAASYGTKIGEFSIVQCTPLMELVYPWIYQCQRINRGIFGYDIYWDFHLEAMNYNVYGENGQYNWHIDRNPKGPEDMKLTCLLNLSEEPYVGGDFCVVGINEKIKFTSGEGLVLNSLLAHKVSPVTKGERITLTYWAYGPSWR
jgi:hypothetical protein